MLRFGLPRLAAVGVLVCLVAKSQAQSDYTLSDLSIRPVLTAMTGGDFTMEPPVIGDTQEFLAGGDFSLQVEVTPLPPVLVVGEVEVFILVENGAAVVTWTGSAAGYVLESSPGLGDTANWQPVVPAPLEQRFVASLQGAGRFFRLRHP